MSDEVNNLENRMDELREWLSAFREHNPQIRPYTWIPDTGFYSPPGLYYFPLNGPGEPAAFHGPAPFHPLEMFVAESKGVRTPDTGITSDLLLEGVKLIRGYHSWLHATEAYAKLLEWPLDWTRFAYYLLTPMVVNAGGPPKDDVFALRTRLYEAAGVPNGQTMAAIVEGQQNGHGGDAPRKEFRKFWGNECYWPLRWLKV